MVSKKNYKKFESNECNNSMTFQECELAILRHAVDTNEKVKGQKLASGDEIKKMIDIVEKFLVSKRLICYGGTAINNILPRYAQFYNRDYEIPDYDFFSPNAMDDVKELADIFYKEGYTDVEAKSGIHHGTYKLFVNFIPMADVTFLDKELFNALLKDSISIAGIKYAPANFLRMGMYLELSRPAGDISRWEKVFKRIVLLNKYYPISVKYDCLAIDFQRKMEENTNESENIYVIVRDALIEMGVVFFGGYAFSLYSRHMPKAERKFISKIPDFDVLSEDIEKTALILEERLLDANFKNIKRIHHPAIGDIIPEHIEIRYGNEIIAFLYSPIACHNYNTIHLGNQEINVATIDTIMSFYLAFIYAGAAYYNIERILCMAKFLFELEQKNRLSQEGLLQRFSMKCIGNQETLESIRATKAVKFAELRGKRGSKDYDEWFLKYTPGASSNLNFQSLKIAKNDNEIKDKVKVVSKSKTLKNKKEKKDKFSNNLLLFPFRN